MVVNFRQRIEAICKMRMYFAESHDVYISRSLDGANAAPCLVAWPLYWSENLSFSSLILIIGPLYNT